MPLRKSLNGALGAIEGFQNPLTQAIHVNTLSALLTRAITRIHAVQNSCRLPVIKSDIVIEQINGKPRSLCIALSQLGAERKSGYCGGCRGFKVRVIGALGPSTKGIAQIRHRVTQRRELPIEHS